MEPNNQEPMWDAAESLQTSRPPVVHTSSGCESSSGNRSPRLGGHFVAGGRSSKTFGHGWTNHTPNYKNTAMSEAAFEGFHQMQLYVSFLC